MQEITMPRPQQHAGESPQSDRPHPSSASGPTVAADKSNSPKIIIAVGVVVLLLVLAGAVVLLAYSRGRHTDGPVAQTGMPLNEAPNPTQVASGTSTEPPQHVHHAQASKPLNGAFDRVHHYAAQFIGSARFDTNSSGLTGGMGDFAVQISPAERAATDNGGSVFCNDPNFLAALNTAMANDMITISMWVRRNGHISPHGTSDIWLWSLNESQHRGLNLHGPYTDDEVFHYDTSGFTDSNTRLSARFSETNNPSFNGPDFWLNWHHLVCVKSLYVKQLWVDGVLFLSQTNQTTYVPLYHDIASVWMGSAGAFNAPTTANIRYGIQGDIDDYAFYSTQLNPAQIKALSGGTPPDRLSGANKYLIAWWDFNQRPSPGPDRNL
jgi:hypothetical protein